MKQLENYPNAKHLMTIWFIKKMVSALKDQENAPSTEDMMKNQHIHEYISNVIQSNPRAFFEFFDENGIKISIIAEVEDVYRWSLDGGNVQSIDHSSRIEAETEAFWNSVDIFEEKNSNNDDKR